MCFNCEITNSEKESVNETSERQMKRPVNKEKVITDMLTIKISKRASEN